MGSWTQDGPEAQASLAASRAEASEGPGAGSQAAKDKARSKDGKEGKTGRAAPKTAEAAPAEADAPQFMDCKVCCLCCVPASLP